MDVGDRERLLGFINADEFLRVSLPSRLLDNSLSVARLHLGLKCGFITGKWAFSIVLVVDFGDFPVTESAQAGLITSDGKRTSSDI
jgi:hypothetical protein